MSFFDYVLLRALQGNSVKFPCKPGARKEGGEKGFKAVLQKLEAVLQNPGQDCKESISPSRHPGTQVNSYSAGELYAFIKIHLY